MPIGELQGGDTHGGFIGDGHPVPQEKSVVRREKQTQQENYKLVHH
jgi:hypothetical protein